MVRKKEDTRLSEQLTLAARTLRLMLRHHPWKLVLILGLTLALSPPYTLLILATGGLLFFLLRKSLAHAFRLGEGYVNSYNHLLKYIDDFWQTVKIAKVHSSEDFYSRKFDEASSSLLDLEFRMQKNYALPRMIYTIAGIAVLALARVLLRRPRLLLLDEATSSLDTDNEQQIMEVVSQLKDRVTILFVTHRTSLLPWFDQIIRL